MKLTEMQDPQPTITDIDQASSPTSARSDWGYILVVIFCIAAVLILLHKLQKATARAENAEWRAAWMEDRRAQETITKIVEDEKRLRYQIAEAKKKNPKGL